MNFRSSGTSILSLCSFLMASKLPSSRSLKTSAMATSLSGPPLAPRASTAAPVPRPAHPDEGPAGAPAMAPPDPGRSGAEPVLEVLPDHLGQRGDAEGPPERLGVGPSVVDQAGQFEEGHPVLVLRDPLDRVARGHLA